MIDPIAHRGQTLLQSLALLLPNYFCVPSIAKQRGFELGKNVVWDVNILQNLAQTVADFLLAEVRKLARTAMPSTPVICIAILLNFSRYSALVVCAVKHPGKRKLMLPVFWPVMPLKNVLNLLEELTGNKRCMCPLVRLSLPNKQAGVKGVLKRFLQVALGINTAKFHSDCFAQR
ncbi:MAG: hypothetical protein LAO19_14180 [Acidobacteriia bacterium]|nr:hypothetical protein [Terriglobia bacterium]